MKRNPIILLLAAFLFAPIARAGADLPDPANDGSTLSAASLPVNAPRSLFVEDETPTQVFGGVTSGESALQLLTDDDALFVGRQHHFKEASGLLAAGDEWKKIEKRHQLGESSVE